MRNSHVQSALLALLLATGAGLTALVTEAPVQAQEAKVPVTAEDHLALAKVYQDKAASYRKEADFHRQMFEAYKKGVPNTEKTGRPNPWVVKMQKHCQMLTKDAKKLAADTEKGAEFHTLRAKELAGN